MAKPSKGALTAIAEVDRLLSKYPNPRDVRRAPTLERTGSPLRDASPELYGFLGGAAGTAPDEFEGSVMDPLSARVKAGANYGYPLGLAAEALPGAAMLAKFGAKAAPVAVRNAMAPAQLGKQAGVIKAPGGNWLSGSVEDALKGLKQRIETPADATPRLPWTEQDELENVPRHALNSFIDKQLTRYVKNDMATERDPIRALAERGVLHYAPQDSIAGSRLRGNRARAGFPESGMAGTSELAQTWETNSDNVLRSEPASVLLEDRMLGNGDNPHLKQNPWLAKVPADARVSYADRGSDIPRDLGFNHLMDELRNATNPNSGLPAHLLLDPKSLDRVSVPQAVERVAAINEWRAAQKAEANAALANNAATQTFKEYAENNPKGLKWVEFKGPKTKTLDELTEEQAFSYKHLTGMGYTPDEALQRATAVGDNSLKDALKYEADAMGSCVGGRCDAVMSGASRIYSLRDAKGQPRVTLEVVPGRLSGKNSLEEWAARYEETHGQGSSEAYLADHPEIGQAFVPRINEIKGKGNRKPNDEYLPFVQDFVKSGKWSDVGDLQNTDLLKLSDYEGRMHPELMKRAREQFGNYATQAEMEALHAPKPDTPMPGYARGGSVKSTDKEVDRLLSKYPNPRDVRYAPTLERTGSPLREESPELYGFLGGAMGTAPDEFEGSVLDPLYARVKAGAEYGFPIGTALNVAPLVPAALKGAVGALTRVANAGSGPLAGSLAAQRGVIKAPGGNWLSGSVEDALKGLKAQPESISGDIIDDFSGRPLFAEYRKAYDAGGETNGLREWTQKNHPDVYNGLMAPSSNALNSFIDKQLTRYVKNDMATERDPIRALAERGVLHVDPEQLNFRPELYGKYPAPDQTFHGQSPAAKVWEGASDSALDSPWDVASLKAPQGARFRAANPWIEKLPDETLVRGIAGGTSENLGFPHLMDELRNATNPNSGLPAHLLLDPKSLDRVSVPQAVERVAAINEWRAQQSALAKAAAAEGIPIKKEYQEGFKWLSIPDTAADEKALKYAVDVGCEGGWCTQGPDTAKRYGGGEGGRLHVLVDKNGKAHVQIHEKPGLTPEQLASKEQNRRVIAGPKFNGYDEETRNSLLNPEITEIKGKGNRKPNDEYLPFVQDFVKSGKWSDVGDLQNTGLQSRNRLFDKKALDRPEISSLPEYFTAEELDAAQQAYAKSLQKPQGYATGGTVTAAPAAYSPNSWQALYRKNNATEQAISDQNKITQTKDQFLAKYADALDANGRFVPGKANLWFDGENASDVYDKLIGKQTVQTHYGNLGGGIFKEESFFNPEVNMDWIEDPRAGGGWAGMKGAVLPGLAATAAIMGGQALLGAGGAGSAAGGSGLVGAGDLALAPMPQVTAASLGSNASGLAGALGMKAGVGATALNSGALNAGVTALRGGNLGQVLKSGVQGAVLSPIASYGSEMVGGGTLGSVVGNSLQGGAASVLSGRDAFSGFRDGAVNGLVRMAGDWAGAEAKDFTGSDFAGKAANSLTQTALKGKDIGSTLDQLATQYASGQLTDLSGMDPKMAAIVVNLARNKKGAAINIAAGALTQAAQRAVGSAKLSDRAVGA